MGTNDKTVPPCRNTGVLNMFEGYRYSIDWLRFSVPYFVPNEECLPMWDCFTWEGETDKPLPNYNNCAILPCGRIDWNTERPEQKRLVTLTGKDLQQLINQQYKMQVLVEFVSKLRGLKVSRLDFAIDCYNVGAIPAEIYELHRAGKCKTRAKKASMIETYAGSEKLGETCYIGTRESMKFLRIYDKAKETADESRGEWIRIELEIKDDYALVALAAMARHGIIEGGKANIRGYIVTEKEWFDNATLPGVEGVYVEPVEHQLTDWETWVLQVALPAVQKALLKQVPGVREGVVATLKLRWYGHGKPGKPKE